MSDADDGKTALVTGANSGIGFEAAAQLAQDGWSVVLACRSQNKAAAAKAALVDRVGRDAFSTLVIDTAEVASAEAAAEELGRRDIHIDALILNAGASSKTPNFNSEGVEVTYASTLVGHHALTMQALGRGLLSPKARIIIAGSEGARGNMPGMPVHDVTRIADENYSGDWTATIQDLVRLKTPAQVRFVNMGEYVTAKLLVAWWAAALARRLPAGMTVNAVSPGAALGSNFAREAPTAMRVLMIPMMKLLGPIMGMNGSVEQAASRYVEAAGFGDDETGHFYATAHRKKLVGPLGIQTWPDYFTDESSQEAAFTAICDLTGLGVQAAELKT